MRLASIYWWWTAPPRRSTGCHQRAGQGHRHARLVRVERPGVSFARNAGAEAASSRYIAYIDDDAIPDRTG